ncbi:hypothetical protein [Xenorhabdus doucetiae]|uniref:hypothetical protein n=1 Tax=Xenorhabdus doucetiae TaxID=351671 RepID=UPI002B4164F3|nr:hypothetical protein [Xenorhabdus sp. 18]
MNNHDGGLLLGTTHTEVTARELNNTAGRLQSTRTLTLSNLDKLINQQGMIRANGTLNLNAGMPSVLALFNQGGLVPARRAGDCARGGKGRDPMAPLQLLLALLRVGGESRQKYHGTHHSASDVPR